MPAMVTTILSSPPTTLGTFLISFLPAEEPAVRMVSSDAESAPFPLRFTVGLSVSGRSGVGGRNGFAMGFGRGLSWNAGRVTTGALLRVWGRRASVSNL